MNNRPVLELATSDGLSRRRQSSRKPDIVVSRYLIAVVAIDIDDLVSSVGGWLYDHIAAGWAVNSIKFVEHRDGAAEELEPLTILGYRTPKREVGDLPQPRNRAPHQTLAVNSVVLEKDQRLYQQVRCALNDSCADVVVWGENPLSLPGLEVSTHRLSGAARAFKRMALSATTRSDGTCVSDETCYRPATTGLSAHGAALEERLGR